MLELMQMEEDIVPKWDKDRRKALVATSSFLNSPEELSVYSSDMSERNDPSSCHSEPTIHNQKTVLHYRQ